MEQKIINLVKEKLLKSDYLKKKTETGFKMKVKMHGTELFEDVVVASVNIIFEAEGKILETQKVDAILDLYINQEVASPTGYVDWQMFEVNFPDESVEYFNISDILHELNEQGNYPYSRNAELYNLLMEYYIDEVHDYATAEIKDFVIEA